MRRAAAHAGAAQCASAGRGGAGRGKAGLPLLPLPPPRAPPPARRRRLPSDNEAAAAAAAAAAPPAAAPAAAFRRRGGPGLPQQAVGAGGRGPQQPAHHLEPGAGRARPPRRLGRPAPPHPPPAPARVRGAAGGRVLPPGSSGGHPGPARGGGEGGPAGRASRGARGGRQKPGTPVRLGGTLPSPPQPSRGSDPHPARLAALGRRGFISPG